VNALQTGIVAVLILGFSVAIVEVRNEIAELRKQIAKSDQIAAEAIAKLERDLFARADAEKRNQEFVAKLKAEQQAAEINADVMSLPASGVHQTIPHLGEAIGGQIQ
jgi:hypothetical protein